MVQLHIDLSNHMMYALYLFTNSHGILQFFVLMCIKLINLSPSEYN